MRALVTGASGGIGAAVAETLAGPDIHLVLSGRRHGALDRVASACAARGATPHVLPADLSSRREATALAEEARAWLGGCDVYVSAAGAPRRRHVAHLDVGDLVDAVAVNYLGPAAVALGLLPDMLGAGRGDIVMIGSLAGRVPTPRESAYAAAKHALAGWTDALAVDLQGTGVRAHLVTPAVVDTPLWDVPGQERAPVATRGVAPEAVARAVVALLGRRQYEVVVPARHRVPIAVAAVARSAFVRAAAAFDRARVPEAHDRPRRR